jgi:sulfoxide reductase heme-binding subunit YedZ
MEKTLKFWQHGVRFYIALAIPLVSLEAWWWADTSYAGTILLPTRLEEFFAWTSLACIALALAIGPTMKAFPHFPGRFAWYDARRMIGIAAAWFAVLHVTIAYGALFKWANPTTLPHIYKSSFLVGIIALVVLLLMAFTSFDGAMKGMGKNWYRLHRLIYPAALLILLHAFMIGVHAAEWTTLVILTASGLYLVGMHFYLAFVKRERPTIWQILTISVAILVSIAVYNYGFSQKLGYYPIEGKVASEHHHE